MIHSQKHSLSKSLQSLFTSPGELIHQELGSWGGDSPSVWTTPSLPSSQALRAVPAGQLLLLPHRKPFTPQRISKLTNYSISLAGKHAFLSFHRVPGRAGAGHNSPLHQTQRSSSETREKQPQRMGWAGLCASDVLLPRDRAGLVRRDAGAELHPGRHYEEGKNVKGFQQRSLPSFMQVFELSVAAPAHLTCRVFLSKGLWCFQKDPFGRKTPQNAFALQHKGAALIQLRELNFVFGLH